MNHSTYEVCRYCNGRIHRIKRRKRIKFFAYIFRFKIKRYQCVDCNQARLYNKIFIGENMELKEKIINDIKSNAIILYMKGTKNMPQCGFSNSVVQILNHYGIDYKDINVLEDPNIRIALSEYSSWPTIPQLFVKGELIGGADITIELHQKGELLNILDKAIS
ncbi:MAG: hypothetical protein CM15mP4_0370 [Candidatus Neomarinimicrobiota bacterium]|nr:MAG: hypothetical protein CM15mP4_0370 [Candidatus Neomarinimicrobiota bacterium]